MPYAFVKALFVEVVFTTSVDQGGSGEHSHYAPC